MAGVVRVIWVCDEEVYFFGRYRTGQITLKLLRKIDLSGKSIFARASYLSNEQNKPLGRLLDFALIDSGLRTEDRWQRRAYAVLRESVAGP